MINGPSGLGGGITNSKLMLPARVLFGKGINELAFWLWEAWETGSLSLDSFPVKL